MQGTFIWYELMTTDTAAAAGFYSTVVGWAAKDSGMPGMAYTVFSVPGFDMGVAGMMLLPDELKADGVPPNWTGYVAVDDVDAKAKEFADNGGAVHRDPQDISGIGRFAVVADLHGAVLCLFKPMVPDGPMPPAPAPGTPGTFGWRELMAGNGEEAFDFYAKRFGWTKDMAVDMGAMGTYQCFAAGGEMIGGMMTRTPDVPMAFWGYYINVDAIDAAAARVRSAGGQVVGDVMEVPGPAWVIQCVDPQGAYFALVAPKR
ncbi:VOC family protein [Rhizobium sp. S-51]|uniref:VOC family protein n=1 Tax=Rhizobium terricola TaxID=2728849 RepID=A0A7Y0FW21_9HYPH|nr:VOC family protein [Rhizobium terricola]NML74401.1 VOC family protein [Rhizobium terricola]